MKILQVVPTSSKCAKGASLASNLKEAKKQSLHSRLGGQASRKSDCCVTARPVRLASKYNEVSAVSGYLKSLWVRTSEISCWKRPWLMEPAVGLGLFNWKQTCLNSQITSPFLFGQLPSWDCPWWENTCLFALEKTGSSPTNRHQTLRFPAEHHPRSFWNSSYH